MTTLLRPRYIIPTLLAGLAGLAGIAWLAFGYFGIHTAFIDDKVSEAAPVFDAPAAVEATVDAPARTPVDTAGTASDTPTADAATAAEPVVEPAEQVAADPVQPAAAEPVVEASGEFRGLGRYDVSGDAIVLGNGTGQRFLRFENFDSNNGPDLNVYLVNPDDPDDFVDLGDLKGNIGDQNYEIPPEVDLDRYSQVAIWCVRFSVGFGVADLVPMI